MLLGTPLLDIVATLLHTRPLVSSLFIDDVAPLGAETRQFTMNLLFLIMSLDLKRGKLSF
jgi:hypothetical protein